MTDFAKIAFDVETSELEKGAAALKKMGDQSVETARKLGLGTKEKQKEIKAQITANNAMLANIAGKNKQELVERKAIQTANQRLQLQLKQNNAIMKMTEFTNGETSAIERNTRAKKKNSLASFASGGPMVGGPGDGLGATSSKNVGNRGNFNGLGIGNIAAQFQDIGVTASMGMNPLMVALQQGTQLSAVLGAMESPLKGLAGALKMVFGSTALLTIGIVALVVAGIQLVDWGKLATNIIDSITNNLNILIPVIGTLGLAIIALKWSSIVAGVGSVIALLPILTAAMTSVGVAATAMWAFITAPVTGTVLAIGAVAGVLMNFLGVFKSLRNEVKSSTEEMNNFLESNEGFRKELDRQLFSLTNQQIAMGKTKKEARIFLTQQELINKAVSEFKGEPTSKELEKISRMALQAAYDIEALQNGLDSLNSKKISLEFTGDLNKRIESLEIEKKALSLSSIEADKLRLNYQLLQEAKNKSGLLDKDIDTNAIAESASKIAKLNEEIRLANEARNKPKNLTKQKTFTELMKEAEVTRQNLEMERNLIGLNVQETSRYKFEQQMLNDAKREGTVLGEKELAEINARSIAIGELTKSNKINQDALNQSKDITRTLFKDLHTGIKTGADLWKTFGDTALSVLDKVTNKILDDLVDALFEVNSASKGGGGGGILGSIASFFAGSAATPKANAKGNAFNYNGVQRFAKGGSFTNSIVSKPTMFSFAKGTALGEMGEAGPEAIMPLTRGANGKLGVTAHNIGGTGGKPTVNVEVIVNGNATVEQESSTGSDGTELRRFIINVVNEANGRGDLDSSNKGRYNITPTKVVR